MIEDSWLGWRAHTAARIALGRAGSGLPTREVLGFGWAHAMARDAIHTPLDVATLTRDLHGDGWDTFAVQSQAQDRTTFLRRPDLGRRLCPEAATQLRAQKAPHPDISITIGDGLSSLAVQTHALPLLKALRKTLAGSFTFAPVVIATQARVALADEIGEIQGVRLAIILIGERPGLSSPDSLGIYLTHGPRIGRHDAERNCISNVRPEGLGYEQAAFKLAWLIRQALRLGLSGVALKDESDLAIVEAAPGAATLDQCPR
jgi:ethanolamine ammonia-lyase small subunit